MANNGYPNEEQVPDEIDLTLRLGLPIQNDHRATPNASANMNQWAILAGPANFVFNVAFVNEQLGAPRPHNNNIYVNNNDNNIVIRTCRLCGSIETPLWRRGPLGRRTLCNACGLRFLRAEKKKADKRREGDGEGGGGNGNATAVF